VVGQSRSRGVFAEELEQALRNITALPGAGTVYTQSPIPDVRRVYLRRVDAHLYYTFDDERVIVRAFWVLAADVVLGFEQNQAVTREPAGVNRLYARAASTSPRRYRGSKPSSIQRCLVSCVAGTTRRYLTSNRGSQGNSSTVANHTDRTSARCCSEPVRQTPRQKPSNRASRTTAHASSKTSRRRVSSHDSSPSGRPPGQPHRSPSPLMRMTPRSAVRQNAFAP
jgi:hypothetical protein